MSSNKISYPNIKIHLLNYKKLCFNKFKYIKEKKRFLYTQLSFPIASSFFIALLFSELKFFRAKLLTAKYQNFNFSKNMIQETVYPSYYQKIWLQFYGSFSLNFGIWSKFFKDYVLIYKKINYLEIGCFEGRSSVFVLEKLKNAYCYFVDPFIENDEMTKSTNQRNYKLIYENFKSNVLQHKPRYEIHKTTSNNFFEELEKSVKFNLIYIDGSHFAEDVYRDAVNADTFLEIDGFIIFDDLFWSWYPNLQDNPFFGICKFLNENKKNYKIIYRRSVNN